MFDRRLLLVSGKGGVGKSAVAAGLSILAARGGAQVLTIAMTEPHGLAGHLGIDSLGFDPVEVRPGLHGMFVDRTRSLDEYLRLQLHAPRVAPLTPLAKGLNALADTVPGIRDIITIGKVLYEEGGDRWDLVIADAPPLGQLRSYLVAPATIAGLVPVGRIREQAAGMAATLADAETSGLVLVTTPEELPVVETLEALERIDQTPVSAVIVNRELPPLRVGEEVLADLPPGPHRDAGELHRGLYRSQRRWRKRLPPGPSVPFFFGLHTPAEVAVRTADALGEQL
jgi:anion-transporting  ArsA/GET3 family ATPase